MGEVAGWETIGSLQNSGNSHADYHSTLSVVCIIVRMLPKGPLKQFFLTPCILFNTLVLHSQRGILTNKLGLQERFYPLDNVKPEYLRECRGVCEIVHDTTLSKENH